MSYDKDRAYACVARVKPNKYIMIQNRTLSSRLMSQMTLVNDLMRLVYPVRRHVDDPASSCLKLPAKQPRHWLNLVT